MEIEMNAEQEAEVLEVMEAAVAKLSRVGLENATISDIFLAYGVRVGHLIKGEGVFAAAHAVIDVMEVQSRNNS
jgi:hypothetical protein